MKNGVCPKCGKADVRRQDLVSVLALSRWSFGRPLMLVTYVCAACGYLEKYVRDEDLPRVAAKWPGVSRSDRDDAVTPR